MGKPSKPNMTRQVAIHGGLSVVGKHAEVKNLTLDVETNDAFATDLGSVWFNKSLGRISYVSGQDDVTGNISNIQRLANTDDVERHLFKDVKNTNLITIKFGQPVFSVDGFNVDLANASNVETREVIGLVCDNEIIYNNVGKVQMSGLITGSLEQWFEVTGSTSGLIPNRRYFLNTISGKISPTPPAGDGQHVCVLGKAIDATTFFISVEKPIAL